MRQDKTQNLLWRLARKLGMSPSNDPSVNNLTDDQARPLLSYLDEGARQAWEGWDWQDICIIEQRWYAGPYAPGINITAGVVPTPNNPVTNTVFDSTYSPSGSIIYDPMTGLYWMALVSGDPGSPSVVPGSWYQVELVGQVNILANPYLLDAPLLGPPFPPPPPSIPPASGLVVIPAVIPFLQTGVGEIDTVFGVYATDPRNQSYPIEPGYVITSRGIELRDTQLGSVWVHYRPPFPGIGSEPWVSSISYSQNDLVYYNGDSYSALVANNNVIPGSDNGVTWSLFRIPAYLSAAVITYGYAQALEEDGQDQKANTQYQLFEAKLAKEYDRQSNQQGQTSYYSVIVR